MSQEDLFGSDEGAAGPSRPAADERSFFLALRPPGAVVPRLELTVQQLRDGLGLSGEPIPPARLHVTLIEILFDQPVSDAALQAAHHAAGQVHLPPFDLSFDHVMSFANPQRQPPVVLTLSTGQQAVKLLRQELQRQLKRVGLKTQGSSTPHLTLLYDSQSVPRHAVEPIAWTATEFVFICSHPKKGRHEVLGRWAMGR